MQQLPSNVWNISRYAQNPPKKFYLCRTNSLDHNSSLELSSRFLFSLRIIASAASRALSVFRPSLWPVCKREFSSQVDLLSNELKTSSVRNRAECDNVTYVKILIRMNVRIYSHQQNYTNEYPNIFILICFTRTNVRISIRIENCRNIWIYSNIHQGFTL